MSTKCSASPLISIVVPSFNQGKFIEQTINSILGQNYPNLELIIIDGGSIDNTIDIIEKYAASINYYISEPDNGQTNAINKGFRVAKGDILAWLNSDDMYLPCTLSKIATLFGCDRELKLVYGGCLHFFESQSDAYGVMPRNFDAQMLTYFDYIVQPSTFWSRSLWEAVGELNENYNYVLDWDWFIRASKICEFTPLGDYLALYRIHDNHKTSYGGDKRAQEIVKIVETYAEREWISAYRDIYKKINYFKISLNQLSKLRLYRLRYLLDPKLYLKHGSHRLDLILSIL